MPSLPKTRRSSQRMLSLQFADTLCTIDDQTHSMATHCSSLSYTPRDQGYLALRCLVCAIPIDVPWLDARFAHDRFPVLIFQGFEKAKSSHRKHILVSSLYVRRWEQFVLD